ncbi:glycosyltransferase family 4 protein [Paucihalobacter ruber]|uniref:Glycosyltransferase family 4 protein n=1 Tax=Paucihalobacter ruber TaxID=2567861 RepID=A0A506PPW8_9FLAO|nr:glycosyltransferase family 4 protein [Paucihalobacter ruber]TPV35754.1 glycosyltransferase family 4 protein [Paucihalobacter ruber]
MNQSITFCAYDKPGSIGGPVTWLQHLLPALKQRGLDVRCLILFHLGETGPLYEHLTNHGVPCQTTKFNNYTEDNIKWILECLKNEPPQIFVPNLVVPAYYASKWAKKAGIYTIGVSHSDDPFYHAIQKEFIDGSKDFRLSGMVCVSGELEKQLKGSAFANEIAVERIPYGVHVPQEKAKRLDANLKVVYVGRFAEEQKRISEVAKAFCRMTAAIPNTSAVFYGDGPDKGNLESILQTEGEGLPVSIAGSIPSHEIQKKLLEAHVIVLLSDFEGLPISVLEAMACGVVPVCLQMKSGISEQIKQGVTGFVVNDRNDDFLNAIKTLQADHTLWHTMSKNAKQYISENFTMTLCHEHWFNYLSSFKSKKLNIVSVPKLLKLPSVHPDLARADKRRPIIDLVNLLKLRLGLLKHRLYKILNQNKSM